MKKIVCGLSLVACLAGCGETPEARAKREEVQRQASETLHTAGEYTSAMKEEYRKRMQVDLDKMDVRLDEYRAKFNDATADAKVRMEPTLKELEVQRDKARERLNDLGDESKGAWEDIKTGMDNAFQSLSHSFEKAKDNFK